MKNGKLCVMSAALFLIVFLGSASATMTEAEGYDVIADIQDNGNSANALPHDALIEDGQIYVGVINETSGDFEPLASPKARITSPAGNLILEVDLEPVPLTNEFADMVNYWYNGTINLSANAESGQGSLEIVDGGDTLGVMDVWLTPGTNTFILRVSDTPEITQVQVESTVIKDALGLWSWRDKNVPEIENLLYGYQEFKLFPDNATALEYVEIREIDPDRKEALIDIAGQNVLLREDQAIMKVFNGEDFLIGIGGIETRTHSYRKSKYSRQRENVTLNYAMLTLAPANIDDWLDLVGTPDMGQLTFEQRRFRPKDHEELSYQPSAQPVFTYVTESGDQVWQVRAEPGKTFGPFDVGMRSHYLTTAGGRDWMETTNFNTPQLRWRTKDKETLSYLHLGPFEFNGKRSQLGDFAYDEKMVDGSIWGGPIGVLTTSLHNGYYFGSGWNAQGGNIRLRGM